MIDIVFPCQVCQSLDASEYIFLYGKTSAMKMPDNTTSSPADEYDRRVRTTIPFYDLINEETIDLVRTARPEVRIWLDTGCGTGFLAEKALAVFPETFFLLADVSEKMLDQCRGRLAAAPAGRFRILDPMANQDLPADLSPRPEVVTAIQVHHYLSREDRRRATEACWGLLPEGGLYVTFENVHPNSEEGLSIALERWRRYQVAQGKPEDKAREHGARFNRNYFPITIEDHFRLLKNCGFKVVEMFWQAHMQAGFYAVK